MSEVKKTYGRNALLCFVASAFIFCFENIGIKVMGGAFVVFDFLGSVLAIAGIVYLILWLIKRKCLLGATG